MEELKEAFDEFKKIKEKQREEALKVRKEREEANRALKEQQKEGAKNFLSAGALIGINTVGASLRAETSKLKSEDDLIARIIEDINEPLS